MSPSRLLPAAGQQQAEGAGDGVLLERQLVERAGRPGERLRLGRIRVPHCAAVRG